MLSFSRRMPAGELQEAGTWATPRRAAPSRAPVRECRGDAQLEGHPATKHAPRRRSKDPTDLRDRAEQPREDVRIEAHAKEGAYSVPIMHGARTPPPHPGPSPSH